MLRFFIFVFSAVLALTGCHNKSDRSRSKSFVGLNAELDEKILRGEAPSFLYLQQWFNRELPVDYSKAQAGDPAYQVHRTFTESTLRSLPAQYKSNLVEYLKRQEDRIGLFQANLNNVNRLNQLIDLEANEMADILLALIEPSYTPKTNDLLARLVSLKPLRSFIDRYSVELLEKLYSRSQRSLVLGMQLERDNFAKILRKKYTAGAGSATVLASDLDRDCGKLQQMILAFGTRPAGSCKSSFGVNLTGTAVSVDAAAKDLPGAPGLTLGIFAGLSSAHGFAAAAGVSPKLKIFNNRDPDAGDPYANANVTPPQDGTVTPTPSTTQSATNDTNVPSVPDNSLPNNGNDNDNSGEDNFLADLVKLLGNLLNTNGASLTEDDATVEFSLVPPPKPSGKCSDKSGLELVVCQRYVETLRPMTQVIRASIRQQGELQLADPVVPTPAAEGYNFYMISKYATKVQNQGSEGACTAFGLAHTLGILGRIHGKSGEYDAWKIWNAQGQSPMTDAAISAAKRTSFDGLKITKAKEIRPSTSALKNLLNAGRPIYYASATDGSWNGAGRGNANLTCQGNGGGHAYAIVGYDDAKKVFVIKNSWGDYWGDRGYGYMPYSCVGNNDDSAYDVQVQ